MPIYKYRCNNCGETFEILAKTMEPYVTQECPCCGLDEYHEYIISSCRFKFPGGLPSYQDMAEEDLDEPEIRENGPGYCDF